MAKIVEQGLSAFGHRYQTAIFDSERIGFDLFALQGRQLIWHPSEVVRFRLPILLRRLCIVRLFRVALIFGFQGGGDYVSLRGLGGLLGGFDFGVCRRVGVLAFDDGKQFGLLASASRANFSSDSRPVAAAFGFSIVR